MGDTPMLTDLAEVVWTPPPHTAAASELMRFTRSLGLDSLAELHARAASDPGWFWDAVMKDLGLRWRVPYTQALDPDSGFAFARWCVGGRMNIVDNCLLRWRGTPTERQTAIVFESEDGTQASMTYGQLSAAVAAAAEGLRRIGVKPGDVVGVYMPMVPEIVVGMLAIIAAGGIFLPLFSGFGPDAIATRLSDSGATVLLTADGAFRRGKWVDMRSTAEVAVARCPTVRQVISLRQSEAQPGESGTDWSVLRTPACELRPHDTSAEDVMMLIYTSGTTGKPKGAVHTHCGFPVKSAADMVHGFDVRRGERVYWVTDMGWMMGPWLVFGTLLLGATLVLYDGAVDHPHPGRLWDITAKHGVSLLGVSPTLVRAMMRHPPAALPPMPMLTRFGSTGEPWNPGPWRWLFDTVGQGKRPILNYSGGTEISGGIVCGTMCSPLKPCAFAGPMPGMHAEVWDDTGSPVVGKVGELVIKSPWIGMTRGFWNDKQRYLDTYFSRWDHVWVHGDYATVDDDGYWWIVGRSDDTLKIAGKRLGPAEVESLLVGQHGVVEAVAIGVPDDLKGEALVCFCVLRAGAEASESRRDALLAELVRELGKPLAPKELRFVPELPRTRNGKIMRRLVRAAYLGKDTGDTTALENPGSLNHLRPGTPHG